MSIFAKPDQNFTFHDGRYDRTKRSLREENTMLRRQAAALARHNEYLKELVLQSFDVAHVNMAS
jgi:hypothetical protein